VKNKNYLYIANWKNYFTYQQANRWTSTHKDALFTLAANNTIAICPSFEALSSINSLIGQTAIKLGAQNCSAHNAGPFTGQVLIESLKELGCTYCIIGHPEVQKSCPENIEHLAKKAERLLEHGITPLLCIGETAQDYELSHGCDKIRIALESFCASLPPNQIDHNVIGIAYEPLWAINSNSTPPIGYIENQLRLTKEVCSHMAPNYRFLILYGGGIDETNIREFKNSDIFDGFLIGRASTDFQKLQKIVG
jgi:triosephosphate isomerase